MKLHKIFKTVLCLLLSVSIAGCATMFHGTTQQVSIRSNDDDAKLYVNEAYVGKGSGVATFHKNKDYTIIARKEGCSDTTAIATKSFDATTLLGILLGLGGIVIGIFIVDGMNGAWQQFDQTSYVVDPNCSGKAVGSENAVQESVGKEDKKEGEAVKAEPAHSSMNFNGKK